MTWWQKVEAVLIGGLMLLGLVQMVWGWL